MAFQAFIASCAGPELSEAERSFFGRSRPCGLILFARNCETPEQIRALTDSFKQAVGSEEILILIDQEGGRVQRLKPPTWPQMPPARAYGDLYAKDAEAGKRAAFYGARLIAHQLHALGINTNCAPVLDVPQPGAHEIIGDRAYGTDPETIAILGRAVMDGYLAGGVLPVIKHVPGHGRAEADSHLSLPKIDATQEELAAVDFKPFQALKDAPLAMTAHVLLPVFDSDRPASTSPVIMGEVIRKTIGLEGLVMCDDLGMKALSGTMREKAAAAIAAGCDVALHCSGALSEMEDVAEAVPALTGEPKSRFDRAIAALHAPEPFDHEEALAMLAQVQGTPIVWAEG
ncbi:Beta-hexosaminidase [Methyloligella halotolerans]|uniref:beta-N-acetylhexosaminidase n=1 Tax=Methyloligella halotolerans TaxID=1177755 RepID=A0A1E2S2W3_9HYPH|nr:beta-N-acetylhexosaminidase [Methyloligella halotolerans]ODA68752.1 Beta-hexosaminidase [Methyloligella halotolerans]